jgi:signal transduction histidine kinase
MLLPESHNRFTGWWRSQSIEWTLPATFTLLLVLLVSFYVFAAFRAVERSAVEAAAERIERVGSELSRIVGANNQQRATTVVQTLQSPAIGAALAGGSIAPAESVLARLSVSSDSSATLLLDPEMRVVAQVGNAASPAAMSALARPLRDALEKRAQVVRSPLFKDEERAYYWAVTVVGDSTRPGFFAQLRRLGNAQRGSASVFDQLMGDAIVMVANANDAAGTWIKIEGQLTDAPRIEQTGRGLIHHRATGSFLAHSVAIPGAPWVMVTETPLDAPRARALAFVGRTAPVALGVVLIGALLAWLIAHRYAQPMRALSGAARGIAGGDYRQRVTVRRRDELGELAEAFNQMSQELETADADVQRMNAELEDRVRRRTAELEAANHELRAFSYSVSHDLRSPLRSMDGFSQALLEDYSDKLDETGKDYLRRVRAGSQRMGLLIDDLLLLSKVTLQPITREDVDLSALANEVLADLSASDPERSVVALVEDGMRISADRGLMRVALANLLGNAWKFTSMVAPARIEMGSAPNGERTEFFVRDNGAGFDMQYADRLFTPFHRLHSPAEFRGTGIGLATVQRVIMRHGGAVRAEGAVQRGATFYFSVNGGE